MALGLRQAIDDSNAGIQAAAAAYAKAVAAQDVVAAFDAAHKLAAIADAAVAVFVLVIGGVVAAAAEAEEHTP
jgi:hypothetical protein